MQQFHFREGEEEKEIIQIRYQKSKKAFLYLTNAAGDDRPKEESGVS